jgi:acyl dehydratase
MIENVIGERDFVDRDQAWFAAASGDYNPMHMSAIAARRTLARFPVVHGIHILLWGLDRLFQYLPKLGPVSSIRVRFEVTTHVGDHVQAVLAQRDAQRLRVDVVVEGIRAVQVAVTLGDEQLDDSETLPGGSVYLPSEPLALTFDDMLDYHGTVPFSSAVDEIPRMFSAAARALGTKRLMALACSSFLVGMVCPGLHSVYRGLHLRTKSLNASAPNNLYFHVAHHDRRFRVIRIGIIGAGWEGSLDTQARPEPRAQAALSSLSAKIAPGEFSGAVALVIGGSRGLGELVAKILAAGDARVTLTYSVGEADAYRVQAEIAAHGLHCDVLHYDVQSAASPQLSSFITNPNQIYYMATPSISRRRNGAFVLPLFKEFFSFYVTGLYNL